MNGSDNVELRQLANQIADLGDSAGAIVKQLAELQRVMWAQLVLSGGSWETAANCYIWGLQGAHMARKKTQAKEVDHE